MTQAARQKSYRLDLPRAFLRPADLSRFNSEGANLSGAEQIMDAVIDKRPPLADSLGAAAPAK
jgi:hypothetical protein